MSRKRLFGVDPGRHPEPLGEFLRRLNAPGYRKGGPPMTPLRDTTPAEFRANQRDLGWVLLFAAVAWSLLLLLESRFQRFPDHPLAISGVVVLVVVGIWLRRIGHRR